MSSTGDQLHRFIFDNYAIRGAIVQLNDELAPLLQGHDYPAGVSHLISKSCAAALLLVSHLKFEGRLSVQWQGQGSVRLLYAETDNRLNYRGLAGFDAEARLDTLQFSQLADKGQMAITLEPEQGKRYQGVVATNQGSLAECLQCYFEQSEQLATRLYLFADGKRACGLLLQALPGSTPDQQQMQQSSRDFEHVSQLAQTLTEQEALSLSAPELLYRLYHDDELRLFEPQPVSYQCRCERRRMLASVTLMTREEADALLQQQGHIDVTCEFCRQRYEFDAVDVASAFAGELEQATPRTH